MFPKTLQNENSGNSWLPTANTMFDKSLFFKFWPKMLLTNQIAWLLKVQYLKNDLIYEADFFV